MNILTYSSSYFINDLYYSRSCRVSSQFFQIQQLLLPKLTSHRPIYTLTIKLGSGGQSVNVYRERSGQTFSYTNLHHRRYSSSHSPYEINKTLLTYRKKIVFFPLSAYRSRSLCFPVRCCWLHHNISSFSGVFQRNTRLTSRLHQDLSFYTYIQIKKCFCASQKNTCAKMFFLKWSH